MTEPRQIALLIAADPAVRQRLAAVASPHFETDEAASLASAALYLDARLGHPARLPVLAVVDLHLSRQDADRPDEGLDVLRLLRANAPQVSVIGIVQTADSSLVARAISAGASDVVGLDADPTLVDAAVRGAVGRALRARQLATFEAERASVDEGTSPQIIAGHSRAMAHVMALIGKVAALPTTVLLLGESGTGKELLARQLHRASPLRDGPCVTVNLPAIPRDLIESTLFGHERGAFTGAIAQKIGAFERAAGGTLFLDEIGDLAMDAQSKLLRAIQEGEIERVGGHQPIRTQFRLVAATHVDLARAVQDGRFREDLYYRINVVPVHVPPLRDRQEDIPALVAHFLQRYNARFHKAVDGVTPEALRLLALYRWPGNVRELENLIERLVALTDAGWIDGEDLPLEWQLAALEGVAAEGTSRFAAARETFERSYVRRALEVCGMNVTATAAYLGVPLSTLKYTMTRLAVRPPARVSREGQPPTD